ncbi:MAG: hypothetical protein Kow006_10670 [Gammaproteobacteria bacterium]
MPDEHHPDLAKRLAWFTSAVTVILSVLFLSIFEWGLPPEGSPLSEPGKSAVIILMLISGALGGCLYNFRGITKHMKDCDFYSRFELTYRLRPISGALCGLFVFALVYGGVLTLTLGATTAEITHRSAILYIAVSLLAGYGSHEFLHKVKDINHTIFALSDMEKGNSSDKDSTG